MDVLPFKKEIKENNKKNVVDIKEYMRTHMPE